MIDRINALGQFLVNQTGKTFNFKSIKSDHMYPGILFFCWRRLSCDSR